MILIILTLILCIIIFAITLYNQKFNFISIKLKNITERINSSLIKRKKLLEDSEQIIKSELNTKKAIYENLKDLNKEKLDMIKLDRKLLVYIKEFYLIKDKYKNPILILMTFHPTFTILSGSIIYFYLLLFHQISLAI